MEAVVEYDYDAEHDDELTLRVGDVIKSIVVQDGGWWQGELKGRRGMFPDNFVRQTKSNKQIIPSKSEQTVKPKRRCRVIYSYSPANEDELELEVDDLIEVLEEVEEGWWRGVLKGRVGVFPSNFVKEVGSDSLSDDTNEENEAQKLKNAPIKSLKNNSAFSGNMFLEGQLKQKAPAPTTNAAHQLKTTNYIPNVRSTTKSNVAPPSGKSIETDISDDTTAPALPPKPVRDLYEAQFNYIAQNEDELSFKEGEIISVMSKDIEDKGWWKGELNGKVGLFPDNFVEPYSPSPELKTRGKSESPSVKLHASKPFKSDLDKNRKSTKEEVQAKVEVASKLDKQSRDIPAPSKSTAELRASFQQPASPPVIPVGKKPPLNLKAKPVLPSDVSAPNGNLRKSVGGSVVDGNIESRAKTRSPKPTPVGQQKTDDNSADFSGLECSSAKLTHITANRVKAPARRPPSQNFLKDNATAALGAQDSNPVTCNGTSVEPNNKERVSNGDAHGPNDAKDEHVVEPNRRRRISSGNQEPKAKPGVGNRVSSGHAVQKPDLQINSPTSAKPLADSTDKPVITGVQMKATPSARHDNNDDVIERRIVDSMGAGDNATVKVTDKYPVAKTRISDLNDDDSYEHVSVEEVHAQLRLLRAHFKRQHDELRSQVNYLENRVVELQNQLIEEKAQRISLKKQVDKMADK